MSPTMIKWLQEHFHRLYIPSSPFFKIYNIVSNAMLILFGLPYLATWLGDVFNYAIPEPFATMSNKFLTGLGAGLKWLAILTVSNPVVGQTKSGKPIEVPDGEKMPYSTEAAKKQVDESVPEPKVIPQVPEKPKEEPKKEV